MRWCPLVIEVIPILFVIEIAIIVTLISIIFQSFHDDIRDRVVRPGSRRRRGVMMVLGGVVLVAGITLRTVV